MLTFTATCSLAVRLDGPEASKVLPSTSTAIVKTGTWTGPVWDISLYWRPGFSWLSLIRAFIAWGGSAFSSAAGGITEWRCYMTHISSLTYSQKLTIHLYRAAYNYSQLYYPLLYGLFKSADSSFSLVWQWGKNIKMLVLYNQLSKPEAN